MSRSHPTPATSFSRSYLTGLSVEAQAESTTTLSNNQTAPGPTYALARDPYGSVRALVDAAGQTLQRFDYRAFGDPAAFEQVNPTTQTATPLPDTQAATIHLHGGGAEWDPVTRRYYHDARWRDARTTWLSRDPYEAPTGDLTDANKYAFVGNNPINATDPTGMMGLVDVMAAAGMNSYLAAIQGGTGRILMNQTVYGVKAGLAVSAIEAATTLAAFGIGWAAGAIIGEVASYAVGRLTPLIGNLVRTLTTDAVQVFRVEGRINARILIDESGNVAIKNSERMLFLNFGSRERAIEFLERRLSQGMEDAVIKSFKVERKFLTALQESAVPESLAKKYPTAPISVDVTKAPDQYGLRMEQIKALLDAIIPGSGEMLTL